MGDILGYKGGIQSVAGNWNWKQGPMQISADLRQAGVVYRIPSLTRRSVKDYDFYFSAF